MSHPLTKVAAGTCRIRDNEAATSSILGTGKDGICTAKRGSALAACVSRSCDTRGVLNTFSRKDLRNAEPFRHAHLVLPAFP